MLNEKFTQKKEELSEDELDAISGGNNSSWLSILMSRINSAISCPECGSNSIMNIGGKEYECQECHRIFSL